ncbi:MAG: hypothetical protein KC501_36925 [Myxococcales bacterium]|nr:hypothetical protein [Myxococcales bacterium]
MTQHVRTSTLMTLALGLGACQAAEDGEEFRSSYTTNVTLSGGDDGGGCDPGPTIDVDPRRSLFETNQDALVHFTMTSALHAVATNSGLVSQPAVTHDQLVDTYNEKPGLGLGAHCDDEVAFDGTDGLNGYPHICERAEGGQIGNIGEWFPIAVVNRFDLAPTDGSNCGEARLVMASNAQNRMFTIFEAQIPNPDPACGIDACKPVQDFWASLSDIDDPAVRADELRMAYMDGHPDLQAAGFGPFLSKDNLTFGTGQIRTNNFDDFPWTLREFKAIAIEQAVVKDPILVEEPAMPAVEMEIQMGLADASDPAGAQAQPLPQPSTVAVLRVVPVPVAANPFGGLWNDNLALPHSVACQDALVATVQHLMTDDPNLMAVSVPLECLAAESPDASVQQYHQRLAAGSTGPGSLQQRIQDEILALDPGSSLTPANIARRAAFAGGCIGCHQQTNGADLGNGVVAPSSAFFVHTLETQFESCGDGNTNCFVISDALKDTFLPHREEVMETFLNGGPCCEAGPVILPAEDVEPSPLPSEPIAEEEVDVAAFMEAEAELEADGAPTNMGGSAVARSH